MQIHNNTSPKMNGIHQPTKNESDCADSWAQCGGSDYSGPSCYATDNRTPSASRCKSFRAAPASNLRTP
ncbi:hypothetical protein BC830DRAFT_1104006 [Chytriomyces sp. MP71]|nr:hypothetical protein BC830DRAFT_1104006 [Chytriomyces sp. MP71]